MSQGQADAPFSQDFFVTQWKNLLDSCSARIKMHQRTRALWAVIFYLIGVGGLVITNIITADGVGTILTAQKLTYLGIAGSIVVGIQMLLNPGASYSAHRDAVKTFREIYYNTKKCEELPKFFDLQNTYVQAEFAAPTIPFIFWKSHSERIVMNPLLQRQVTEYFRASQRTMSPTPTPVEHQVQMMMADQPEERVAIRVPTPVEFRQAVELTPPIPPPPEEV